MEDGSAKAKYDPLFVRNMIESALRIGLLALLLTLSYEIIEPFTVSILWEPLLRWPRFSEFASKKEVAFAELKNVLLRAVLAGDKPVRSEG